MSFCGRDAPRRDCRRARFFGIVTGTAGGNVTGIYGDGAGIFAAGLRDPRRDFLRWARGRDGAGTDGRRRDRSRGENGQGSIGRGKPSYHRKNKKRPYCPIARYDKNKEAILLMAKIKIKTKKFPNLHD